MRHKVKHVHFVGIGGSGMSGIAEVMLNLGFQVTGSDLNDSATVSHLRSLGAKVQIGHDRANISGANAVVTSTAVKADNPEVAAARAKRIPVVPRAMMLAELMRLKQGIAVAGTHGKTTTTSLIASVLAEADMDPTYVIGGRLEAAGSNAKLGTGEFIVVEADESDASFLYLQPVLAVVTNIDADHMDTYGHDFGRLRQAFLEFVEHLPFYGTAVLCIDDENVRSLLPIITKPVTTYGLSEAAHVRAVDVKHCAGQMRFRVTRRSGNDAAKSPDLALTLNMPGEHNVRNALAAIAVAMELAVPDDAIVRAFVQEEINRAFIGAMSRVYLWMTGGLVLTTIVAMVVALNPDIQAVVFSNGLIVFGLIGAQIGLVLLISATINKLSPAMALGLFFLFAGMMGVTLSVIFVVYDLGTIGLAFAATASIFAGLSIAGLTTKRDLTTLERLRLWPANEIPLWES